MLMLNNNWLAHKYNEFFNKTTLLFLMQIDSLIYLFILVSFSQFWTYKKRLAVFILLAPYILSIFNSFEIDLYHMPTNIMYQCFMQSNNMHFKLLHLIKCKTCYVFFFVHVAHVFIRSFSGKFWSHFPQSTLSNENEQKT